MKNLKGEAVQKAGIIAFALAALVAISSFMTGAGGGFDDLMRQQRYALADDVEASGRIGMIAIDDRSLRDIGAFPWTRSTHAELIEKLQGSGIDGLAFDIAFFTEAPDAIHDRNLADAIRDSEFPIALAVPTIDDGLIDATNMEGNYPLETLTDAGAEQVSIWLNMDGRGAVEYINTVNTLDGEPMQTIAGWLAKGSGPDERIRINWSLDDEKIANYSYSDILENGPTEEMKGMRLIIGADSSMLGDAYAIPSGHLMAGARIHAMGAESIVAGRTPVIPEWAILLATLLLTAILTLAARATTRYSTCAGALLTMPVMQWELERNGIAEVAIGSSMMTIAFLIVATGALHVIRYFYGRMTQNEGTGIPNLMAMKMASHDPGMTIAFSVRNHIDIVSELGSEGRDRIMAKVAQRLEMGSNGRTIYQIDASTFAWRGGNDIDHETTQIESLLALLRGGVSFGNGAIDILANAGIEQQADIGVEQAVTNAVIAANRATERGISWEIYESTDNEEHWKITVLSEISRAIEDGDLWVAYQPKVDSSDGRVIGAEALVRWRHPTRGDVRPDAFIPLLEKANRTDELTQFMLNKAVEDFSRMPGCTVAVNVSPLIIGTGKLCRMVREALEGSDFDPACLTLEVTESERFGRVESIRELEEIKRLGPKISIDDYGMGNSTVNYLKILPADELKIDRSFISNMLTSHSDRIVVGSTIRLAHEMGLKVVAEGVESAEIQACLHEMGCDFIQGYHTGRPVGIDEYMAFSGNVNSRTRKRA